MGSEMQPLVLCIAGGIGSGKSSLARSISEELGWERVSFGDHVKAVAVREGLPTDRQTLQRVGEDLVRSHLKRFCREVLSSAGWSPGRNLVIDGVRHLEVLDVLRQLVKPQDLRLVFVEVSTVERQRRLVERSEVVDFLAAEQHSTEAQRDLLKAKADLILDETMSKEDLLEVIALDWATL